MQSCRLVTILIAAFLLTASELAADQFEKVGPTVGAALHTPVDARGEAMGRASLVAPRGPTAAWWNPAPVISRSEFSASFTSWEFAIPDFTWRPFAVRLDHAAISASYVYSRLGCEPFMGISSYDADGNSSVTLFDDPHFSLSLFGLAADIPRLIRWGTPRVAWSVGLTRKQVREQLEPLTGASAASTDWGSSFAWMAHNSAGFMLRLHGTIVFRDRFRDPFGNPDHDAALARSNVYGIGIEGSVDLPGSREPSLAWMIAFAMRRHRDDNFKSLDRDHLGFEITAFSTLSLRTGYHGYRFSSVDNNWTWGLGLQRTFKELGEVTLALDYAAHKNSFNGLSGRHLDHWTLTAKKTLR